MLLLRKRETTTWLDVMPGVRVQVPALTIATLRAAENAGHRAMADFMRGCGVDSAGDLTPDQLSDMEGVFAEARLAFLAGKIMAWEGVGGDDGVPVDPSPEYVAMFVAEPAVARAFLAAYDASAKPEVTEGNDCAPSIAGGQAAAPNTAEAAAEPAETAPVS